MLYSYAKGWNWYTVQRVEWTWTIVQLNCKNRTPFYWMITMKNVRLSILESFHLAKNRFRLKEIGKVEPNTNKEMWKSQCQPNTVRVLQRVLQMIVLYLMITEARFSTISRLMDGMFKMNGNPSVEMGKFNRIVVGSITSVVCRWFAILEID